MQTFLSPVHRENPEIVVKSDASKKGWGVECNGRTTGGMWCGSEISLHINCLELKAVLSGDK